MHDTRNNLKETSGSNFCRYNKKTHVTLSREVKASKLHDVTYPH